jgi:beta-phosphoglucomutase-like phosphatase (HAD superfamily)
VNFAISRSAPNGYWHRLERGEIELNEEFFRGFSGDLHNENAWGAFQQRPQGGKKKLKDLANPTQLGDPVSLKAETADSMPTDQDRGSASSSKGTQSSSSNTTNEKDRKSLKELATQNPTMLGDPVSLKAETANSEPTDQDRGASSSTSGGSPETTNTKEKKSLKTLATQNPTLLGDPVSLKAEKAANSTPTGQGKWDQTRHSNARDKKKSLPQIEAEPLFWRMMTVSRSPNPHVHPYLTHLSSLRPNLPFLLGALSNTVTFPPGHPFAQQIPTSPNSSTPSDPPNTHATLRSLFHVFVASAEVGLRKPDPKIYELALRELNKVGKENVEAKDVLFIDDIGENLKAAKGVGMRTLRVELGKGEKAVGELEGITGIRMEKGKERAKL